MERIPIATAFGTYCAVITDQGLAELHWPGHGLRARQGNRDRQPASRACRELIKRICREIQEYHLGKRTAFTIPLDLTGHTRFRARVWNALCRIPYGQVRTYAQIGRSVGCTCAQAIGQACGANPVPIVVPCHRVVAAGGRLGGFGPGPRLKRKLLLLEGVQDY